MTISSQPAQALKKLEIFDLVKGGIPEEFDAEVARVLALYYKALEIKDSYDKVSLHSCSSKSPFWRDIKKWLCIKNDCNKI